MQALWLWAPVAVVVFGMGFILLWIWFDCPERTPEDVIEFLQHVNLEKFEVLLDPVNEISIRKSMSGRAFRRVQRKRVHLCIENLKRMSHNAGLMTALGSQQVQRGDTFAIREAGRALQAEGLRVNLYSVTMLLKLRLRLLIRMDSWFMFGALSLYGVRESFGVRGLESYDKLKTIAGELFLQLQSSRFEDLLEVM